MEKLKASELRIGNYIQVCGPDDVDILQVDSNDIINVEEVGMPTYVEGVPLTEDWLLKFGFEKINHIADGEIFVKNNIKINSQFGILYQTAYLGVYKYVHQLQNLYFALVQTELEIIKKN